MCVSVYKYTFALFLMFLAEYFGFDLFCILIFILFLYKLRSLYISSSTNHSTIIASNGRKISPAINRRYAFTLKELLIFRWFSTFLFLGLIFLIPCNSNGIDEIILLLECSNLYAHCSSSLY